MYNAKPENFMKKISKN